MHMPYISLKILKPQSTSIHQLQFCLFVCFFLKEEKEEEEEISDKTNGEGECRTWIDYQSNEINLEWPFNEINLAQIIH